MIRATMPDSNQFYITGDCYCDTHGNKVQSSSLSKTLLRMHKDSTQNDNTHAIETLTKGGVAVIKRGDHGFDLCSLETRLRVCVPGDGPFGIGPKSGGNKLDMYKTLEWTRYPICSVVLRWYMK